MSLRDRIAEAIHRVSCAHLDIEIAWDAEQEDVRARIYKDADAILALPEIAALRDVADAAKDFMPKLDASIDAEEEFGDGSDEYWEAQRVAGASALLLDAALARLEEVRR